MTKSVNDIRRLPILFHKSTIFALIEVSLSPREQIRLTKADLRSILASYFNILNRELQFTRGVTKTETESITHKARRFASSFCRETLTCCRMASPPHTHINKCTNSQWVATRHHSCFSSVKLKQESGRVERITEWFPRSLDLKNLAQRLHLHRRPKAASLPSCGYSEKRS